MKKFLTVALALSMSAVAAAQGLAVGEAVGVFYVQDVTGAQAGTKICPRLDYGDRPVVAVFTRELNPEVQALLRQVDKQVGQNQGQQMAGVVVLLTNEPEARTADIKSFAQSAGLKNIPVTVFNSVAGPAPVKIPTDTAVTVMMWVGGKVRVNDSFKAGELSSANITLIAEKSSQILR